MLRHYSTSRTAVLSIAIPVCAAILGWVLATPTQSRLTIYLLIAEVVVFAYTLVLSLFFSAKYEQTRRALVRLEAGEDIAVYNSIVGTRLRGGWYLDAVDKSLVCIGLLLHLAYYAYYFTR